MIACNVDGSDFFNRSHLVSQLSLRCMHSSACTDVINDNLALDLSRL